MAKVLSEDWLLGLMPWVSRWNGAGNVVVVVVAIDDRQQSVKKTATSRNMLKIAHSAGYPFLSELSEQFQ